jgi:hypothetical protein
MPRLHLLVSAVILFSSFVFHPLPAVAADLTSPTLDLTGMSTPTLCAYPPFPSEDASFTSKITELVIQSGLDEHTPADKNPDNEEEWSSICIVDMCQCDQPRVGQWHMDNFLYPASTYKMYVLGEAIREVCAGELSLDQMTTVSEVNARGDDQLKAGDVVPFSEILRLMCMYSNNTAANVAIDTVDRRRATMLLHALGLYGSEITRKYVPRSREEKPYQNIVSTAGCAEHYAKFLWAVDHGAIGGGRGRGLIKAYLATNVQNSRRIRAGVPQSATVYSKTGEWNTFTAEEALVEDGPVRYIICIMTALPEDVASPRIANFARSVHQLLSQRANSQSQ